jgi:outer membrane protein TolC
MLARASAAVAARQADLELAEDLLRLSIARRDAGTTAEIDVTRARAQVASARGALVSARNEETQRRVDLCRALGLEPGTAVQLTDSLDATFAQVGDPGSVDAAVARGIERRHDLEAARLRIRSARQAGSAARAEWIPRLEAFANGGLSGERPGDAESVREVGVRLTWPFAAGFAGEARIARQRAQARAAEVSATDAAQSIDADVRRAWAALETGRELERVADERSRLAQDEVAQARVRLQEGVAGNLDVIEAQSSLVRARDAIIDARASSALARIELARAMGAAQDLH